MIWSPRIAKCVFGLSLLFATLPVSSGAQMLAQPGWAGFGVDSTPWWRNAVFYELDPLTFQDSNGDGIGDFAGITQRLDYLQSLNVDAIVLSPLNVEVKAGASPMIDPVYGSSNDFDELLQQATRRKIRLVVDLPLTSTVTIPEITGLARFWLNSGVAGLRLTHDPADKTVMTSAQVGQMVAALRPVVGSLGGQRVLLTDSSLGADGPAAAGRTTGKGLAPLLTLDRQVGFPEHLSGAALKAALSGASGIAAPVFLTDSADQPRALDRYHDAEHADPLARLLATILLTQRSGAQIYQGQELGLTSAAGAKPETPHDASLAPIPMPWGDKAGFTTGKPWLPVPAKPTEEAEDGDPTSLLNWYRTLSMLHHNNPAFTNGPSALIETGNPEVVAWTRKPEVGGMVVVVCNLSAAPVTVNLKPVLHSGFLRSLVSSAEVGRFIQPAPVEAVPLGAYGVYLGVLSH